uniref:Uncharacterized protein n=1 Tax=Rousettus aegyptiacus TaxID=9407 RepID=A0A7J8CHU3_ROUAE|nr:hypothetical protein HJG63_008968 [Rousettus aegyptiacus]
MSFHFVLDVRAFSRLLSRPHLSPSLCYLLWGNALFCRPIYCQPRPNSEWETWWLTTGSRALPGSQRVQPLPPGAPQARGSRARGWLTAHFAAVAGIQMERRAPCYSGYLRFSCQSLKFPVVCSI